MMDLDLDKLKKLADALIEAEVAAANALEIAFNAIPDSIVIVDVKGYINMINDKLPLLTGYSAEELIGMNIDNLVPDKFRPNHINLRAGYNENPTTRAMGNSKITELFLKNKQGEEIPVSIALNPIHRTKEKFVMAVIRRKENGTKSS